MDNSLFYMNVLTQDKDKIFDLVQDFWPQNNENLWVGEIPFKLFKTDYENFVTSYLNRYFLEKRYLFDIETIDVDRGEEIEIELVCKTAYLVNEYLKTKNFRDPLCAHYNPRLDKHVIHPGGTRQIVLDLFHQDEIKTFYFNTRGYKFDFMKKLKIYKIENFLKDRKYNLAVVPDHGTLIPHILSLKGVNQNPKNMIKMHNFIKDRLSKNNFKIFYNRDIDFLDKWRTSNIKNANVAIHFKNFNEFTKKDIIKAVYLMLSGKNYADKRVIVRHSK